MSVTVKISQWPEPIDVDEDQTILEAALEQGVPFPHGCRSGNCGACKCRLYSGEVDLDPYSGFALTDEEREEGFVLACRAHPRRAVELAWMQDDGETAAHPLRRIEGTVVALDAPTHDIRRVRIEIPGPTDFAFSAGQYASLGFAGQPPRDYSMANRPDERLLEFHIRAVRDGSVSAHVAGALRVGDPVRVEGPFGTSYLRARHRGPILALAGGSGLAPIKSIVETALQAGMTQPIHLYVGVRDERDVYLEDHFRTLAAAHPNLSVTVVLSEPGGETTRRTGHVGDAAAADLPDLDGFKAYLAGPPVMVESAVDRLCRQGLRREDVHADAFYTEAEKAALDRGPSHTGATA